MTTFDHTLIARCGAYCGDCSWKEPLQCPGCLGALGDMSWGTCQVAKCSLAKGYTHCGECPELPCDILQGAFDEPEHGDGGERLANLQAWARGEQNYIPIGTYPRKSES
jgi:hypothetical protein